MNDDLISRRALLDYCGAKAFNALELWDGGRTREAWLEAFEVVRNAPAVDAEPVNHSMWLENHAAQKTRYWTCLNCDTLGSPRWKRCPVCEAKMDLEG